VWRYVPVKSRTSSGSSPTTGESRHSASEGSIIRRAIIVTALLLGGATSPLPVADAAFVRELTPASLETVNRTVDSGMDLMLSRPTFWNSACNARGVTVTVTQPPANGTVSVTEGSNIANPKPKFGTPGRCGGMQIMGKQVVYRSRPGFHGTDVMAYQYVSGWGQRSGATVIITVR
jgi:hypothetical protein